MKIAIDVMGSANGATNAVLAAREFAKSNPDKYLYLIGDQLEINTILNNNVIENIEIINASKAISADSALDAATVDSNFSLGMLFKTVDTYKVDVLISAGSLMHFFAMALIKFAKIKHLNKTGFLLISEQLKKTVLMADYYVNDEFNADDLFDYALISQLFSKTILNNNAPRLGLISNGSEQSKGLPSIQEAHQKFTNEALLKNYGGLVEGRNYLLQNYDALIGSGHDLAIVFQAALGASAIIASQLDALVKSDEKLNQLPPDLLRPLKEHIYFSINAFSLIIGIKFPCILIHNENKVSDYLLALNYCEKLVKGEFFNLLEDTLYQVHQK